MSFVSRLVTTALVAGGLSVAGTSYAHQVQCGYGHYSMLLTNHYNYGGNYTVSCTNGYMQEHLGQVFVPAFASVSVAGHMNGNVTCTVMGVSASVHSGFCP